MFKVRHTWMKGDVPSRWDEPNRECTVHSDEAPTHSSRSWWHDHRHIPYRVRAVCSRWKQRPEKTIKIGFEKKWQNLDSHRIYSLRIPTFPARASILPSAQLCVGSLILLFILPKTYKLRDGSRRTKTSRNKSKKAWYPLRTTRSLTSYYVCSYGFC